MTGHGATIKKEKSIKARVWGKSDLKLRWKEGNKVDDSEKNPGATERTRSVEMKNNESFFLFPAEWLNDISGWTKGLNM